VRPLAVREVPRGRRQVAQPAAREHGARPRQRAAPPARGVAAAVAVGPRQDPARHAHARQLPQGRGRERVPGDPGRGPGQADRGGDPVPDDAGPGRGAGSNAGARRAHDDCPEDGGRRSEPLAGGPFVGQDGAEVPRQGYALIVGVDGPDRKWAAATLQDAGLEVAAATEDEILAHEDWVPPTLIILDDQGTAEERKLTQKRLQKHRAFIGVPLLILAYDADIDSYTGALTRGAAGYLVKPANAEEFTAAAQKLCDWKHNADRSEK